MATRMQQRRGTAAQWISTNDGSGPILAIGEIGYESDTNKFKIGDGVNHWSDLAYFVDLETMIAGAPGLLNSLDEIAAAINDDPAFFTTIASSLSSKAPLASPTFTGTVSGVTKAMVGLGSVDNTADSAKPVSTAQQTALDLKAPLASPTFTGTVSGVTKSHVGLGSVDNTSDANKPVSTATQNALDAKASNTALSNHEADTTNIHGIADTSALATKTYADNAASTAVAAVVNAAPEALDTLKELADALTADEGTAATLATLVGTKAPSANPTFTGTVAGITKSMVGLGNVDNTSDANKPVSTATQTALDAKLASATAASTYAPIASPTFTGTVSGVTKSMVGLGNVDNTSDANKPVSTATQTALDAKFNSADASTTNITEGTNKYFTDERAQDAVAAAIAAGTHSNITITYDDASNKFSFAAENGVADSTTTDLAEGNNQYFTEERAQDAVGNSVGTGLSYDDASGSISVNTTTIQARVENVSDTEIGYLNGVTSSIQTQLDAKLNAADIIDGGGV
jgi:hypothetical protein